MVVYLFLAIGAVLPINTPLEIWLAMLTFVFAFGLLFRPLIWINELLTAIIFVSPFIVIFSVGIMKTYYLDYALMKFDGAVLTTIVTTTLFGTLLRVYGTEIVLKKLLFTILIIFILTLLYKLRFGFWDRGVRFFINGPIVFGWMMSAGAIISLIYFQKTTQIRYFTIYVVLFCAVLWTLSKGPLLSLSCVSFFVLMRFGNIKRNLLFLIGASLAFLTLINLLPIDQLERLSAISRLLSGQTIEADAGSLGTRMAMIPKSIEIIEKNTLYGVGLGNWKDHAGSLGYYVYPHNILLEVFSEIGFLGGMIFAIAIVCLWLNCPKEGQAISLVFLLGSLVSGDAAYLRLPLTILIAFQRKSLTR